MDPAGELSDDARAEVAATLTKRLHERLRLRVIVLLGDPGSVIRQETGKAKRVWDVTSADDPLAAMLAGQT